MTLRSRLVNLRPLAILTLTTDFGFRDAFVAAMKGVVLGIAPDLTIVDITHDIAPHDVWGGAITLLQAAQYFPHDTVHLVVVDPGVGTKRAPIVISTANATFVGPDNGVLTLAVGSTPYVAYRIDDEGLFSPGGVSATFHGRDVFAPVAARLATGLNPPSVGAAHQPVVLEWPTEPEVVHIDRFGNLILSLRGVPTGATAIEIDGLGKAPLRRTYADVLPGELVAYLGSGGLVEVAVREGSAADRVSCCLPGGDPRGLPAKVVVS